MQFGLWIRGIGNVLHVTVLGNHNFHTNGSIWKETNGFFKHMSHKCIYLYIFMSVCVFKAVT